MKSIKTLNPVPVLADPIPVERRESRMPLRGEAKGASPERESKPQEVTEKQVADTQDSRGGIQFTESRPGPSRPFVVQVPRSHLSRQTKVLRQGNRSTFLAGLAKLAQAVFKRYDHEHVASSRQPCSTL